MNTQTLPDPQSLDMTRPDDMDICHVCKGSGEIPDYQNEWGTWETAYCSWCRATGFEPVL